jgi:hypothetical protein
MEVVFKKLHKQKGTGGARKAICVTLLYKGGGSSSDQNRMLMISSLTAK